MCIIIVILNKLKFTNTILGVDRLFISFTIYVIKYTIYEIRTNIQYVKLERSWKNVKSVVRNDSKTVKVSRYTFRGSLKVVCEILIWRGRRLPSCLQHD